MPGMMAKLSWIDAYNFARVNPGQASAALLLVWPLFIAFAVVLVALSPVVFPGAMIAAYVLKHTNAPAIEKPKPKASSAPGASYAEMYPEVQPNANLRKCARHAVSSVRSRATATSRRLETAARARRTVIRPSARVALDNHDLFPRRAEPLLTSPSPATALRIHSSRAQVREVGRPRQAHRGVRRDQQDHGEAHHGD